MSGVIGKTMQKVAAPAVVAAGLDNAVEYADRVDGNAYDDS